MHMLRRLLALELLYWVSKKQNVVANSPVAAEYIAVNHAKRKGLYFTVLLDVFRVPSRLLKYLHG